MTEFSDAIQDQTLDTDPPPSSAPESHDTYEELIEVTLTEADQQAKRERLETVDRELIRLDLEKKAAVKVFTNQIKPLEAERESIVETLASGTEKRPIECYEHEVTDGAGNIVRIEVRRRDTDEVIEERAATESEQREAAERRQGNLFDGGGSQPPPADDDPVTPEDFEPTPEALAQAAEDEQRVVRTSSKEAKAKKAKRALASERAE